MDTWALLVPAAKVAAVTCAIVTLVYTFTAYTLTKDVLFGLQNFLLIGIFSVLTTYDVNCIFVGRCNVWGWFKTVMLVMSLLFALITSWQLHQMKNVVKKLISPSLATAEEY